MFWDHLPPPAFLQAVTDCVPGLEQLPSGIRETFLKPPPLSRIFKPIYFKKPLHISLQTRSPSPDNDAEKIKGDDKINERSRSMGVFPVKSLKKKERELEAAVQGKCCL